MSGLSFIPKTYGKARAGEMFSSIGKGAPAAVKASIIYNDLIRYFKKQKLGNLLPRHSQKDSHWQMILEK